MARDQSITVLLRCDLLSQLDAMNDRKGKLNIAGSKSALMVFFLFLAQKDRNLVHVNSNVINQGANVI